MKIFLSKIVALAIMISFFSFSFSSKNSKVINLSGKWALTIDNKIDGNISGNNGCEQITFVSPKDNMFNGEYSSCPGSNNAKGSTFRGQVFSSERGILVSMVQDNEGTNYYSAWSGQLIDKGTIKGIWTDLEGNQGEFKLTR